MDKTVLRDKIYGCWFGKCLGGAVGMPYEGVPYTVNMTEESIHLSDVPNDDLELQLVWLETLRTHGISLRCADLGEIWKKRIPCGCDEYSIALYNWKYRTGRRRETNWCSWLRRMWGYGYGWTECVS